jgi:hypothetical protein
MNPFVLAPTAYRRDLNIVQTYIDDSIFYLARNTGQDVPTCTEYVLKNIQAGGHWPLHDPAIQYLEAKTRGNRALYEGTLLGYLKEVKTEQLLLAPSLTSYVAPEVRESHLGKYILGNMNLRNSYKKLKFKAKQDSDPFKMVYYEVLQTTCKIKNNSLSGAHASPYTPLYNKSSHSSLTSTCRIATSYSNAQNEKMIAGNRHYWSPDIVVANMITLARRADVEQIQLAIQHHGLYIPTPDDCISVITYSSNQYWRDLGRVEELRAFASTLTDVERCAFVYSGDLYHLGIFNPELVRGLLDALSTRALTALPEAKGSLFQDEDVTVLATLLCKDITQGISLDTVKANNPYDYDIVETTAYNIQCAMDTYNSLIQGLLRPTTLPQSVATIPNMVRKAVITSDTDSTIFTTQHWTIWYTGSLNFSDKSYGIGYAITFLASKMVSHCLALMSANLGIGSKRIHRLRMKNEYYFPLFSLTPSAKTYYAYKSAQEGLVFKEMELELKGVALRSSNAPKEVNTGLKEYLKRNMDTILRDNSISIKDILSPVVLLENDIYTNVTNGGHRYYKSVQIKDQSSYVQGADSPASQYHDMWKCVWGPKYGECPEPPYAAVKVSLDLDNRTKLAEWLEKMEDRELSQRAAEWFKKTGKLSITTMMMPTEIITRTGVPIELIPYLEKRKLQMDIAAPFYVILESYGVYMLNKNTTRLISDTWGPQYTGIQPGAVPLTVSSAVLPAIPE